MRKLICSLVAALGCALAAPAVDQITVDLTVTNIPVTGNTFGYNAITRTWTNAHSATTILTNLVGLGPAATNLFFNLSAYRLADASYVTQTATNIIRIYFSSGVAITINAATTNWASWTYTTNTVTLAHAIRVPHTVEAETNQINFASQLVSYLGVATNNAEPAWHAMTNFPGRAANTDWTGSNTFRNGGWTNASIVRAATISGTLGALTNGVLTNTILQSPTMTNGINYGTGFRSPGAGTFSLQLGAADATGNNSTAVGDNSTAAGDWSTALGTYASAGATNAVAIGAGADATATNSIALGKNSTAAAIAGIAIGQSSFVPGGHTNSIALGNAVTTTETNQILLGTAAHKVRIPGQLEPTGTITNAVMTGTNKFGSGSGVFCALTFPRFNLATVANTNNTINPSNAVYVKISGPSSTWNLEGIEEGYDGRVLIIQNSTGYSYLLENEDGGTAAANRILTGTGAALTLTNNPSTVQLIYDASVSRWVVLNASN